jgi:hypothetical protein
MKAHWIGRRLRAYGPRNYWYPPPPAGGRGPDGKPLSAADFDEHGKRISRPVIPADPGASASGPGEQRRSVIDPDATEGDAGRP